MHLHEFVDIFGTSMGAIVARKNKYFSKGTESEKIIDIINSININMPTINGEGYYPVIVKYEDKKEEAAFFVDQWLGSGYPTIIYHHGAAEGSYDFSYKRILSKNKKDIQANLIAIQAPYNHDNKDFLESIAYLSNYTYMLASSVVIIEKLITQLRESGAKKIVVTGVSLGGFVTNLHFTYINSADEYRPLFSGGNLAEAFIESAYSKITSSRGKQNPEKLREVLNFEKDLKNKNQSNLYPLLGKYDKIVEYETQIAGYDSAIVRTIPFSHSTGAIKFKLLREFILESL